MSDWVRRFIRLMETYGDAPDRTQLIGFETPIERKGFDLDLPLPAAKRLGRDVFLEDVVMMRMEFAVADLPAEQVETLMGTEMPLPMPDGRTLQGRVVTVEHDVEWTAILVVAPRSYELTITVGTVHVHVDESGRLSYSESGLTAPKKKLSTPGPGFPTPRGPISFVTPPRTGKSDGLASTGLAKAFGRALDRERERETAAVLGRFPSGTNPLLALRAVWYEMFPEGLPPAAQRRVDAIDVDGRLADEAKSHAEGSQADEAKPAVVVLTAAQNAAVAGEPEAP